MIRNRRYPFKEVHSSFCMDGYDERYARREQESPQVLREILGYWDEFDVVLTAPFRTFEGSRDLFEHRFPFYERIGAVVSGLGKSIFLPHRDLDFSQDKKRQSAQLLGIIIPSSQLEIAYFPRSPHFESLGQKTIAPGVTGLVPLYHDPDMLEWDLMWSRARTSLVPSISVHPADTRYPEVRGMPNQVDEIPFETDEEALQGLEKSVRHFFS